MPASEELLHRGISANALDLDGGSIRDAAGVLVEILVNDGETVAVDTVVARLETDSSAAATVAAQPPAPVEAGAAPKAAAAPAARRRAH